MIIIGRRDFIDFPQWNLKGIEAKIDTGAYGCSIHCHHVEIMDTDVGQQLRFQLLDPGHPEYEDQYYYVDQFEQKSVKSSSGLAEERYVISTKIRLFGKTYRTSFSLADRSAMRSPVLLGRKFLRNRFLVDVTLKNLSFNNEIINK